MDRGLARPFAARLIRQQSGFCIVPVDGMVRQSNISHRDMGFNKRKMEDQRRQVAEKEAAARRVTDAQVLEDAERLIIAWNERQAKRMPMLFSPTIGAAITAGYWFLWVRCPACRTTNALDLRTLDRHRDAAMTSSFPRCPAARAGRTRHSPSSCGYRGPASRMKCARNTRGGCLASDRRTTAGSGGPSVATANSTA
jgi:hypothetical protein